VNGVGVGGGGMLGAARVRTSEALEEKGGEFRLGVAVQ